MFEPPIVKLKHTNGHVQSLAFKQAGEFAVDSIFTTQNDVYHNTIADMLGAKVDAEGQILVDEQGRTTVPGLYAAGCVTPANCQMIIAAGQGAAAAQAINRDLFEESLRCRSLRNFRARQCQVAQTVPEAV